MAMGLHGTQMRRGGGRRAPMAEINVTPLVDVMLVLLIIFMVTAPLLAAGVPLELPDSRANALPQDQEAITVSVLADGSIYIDEDQLAPGELADRLAGVAQFSGGQLPVVTLRADRSLDYGRVMGVMGEINRAGFGSISLVTNTAVPEPTSVQPAATEAIDVDPSLVEPQAPSQDAPLAEPPTTESSVTDGSVEQP